MVHFAVERWCACVSRLDARIHVGDALRATCGVDLRTNPTPHYSGNIWWARADHWRREGSNYARRLAPPFPREDYAEDDSKCKCPKVQMPLSANAPKCKCPKVTRNAFVTVHPVQVALNATERTLVALVSDFVKAGAAFDGELPVAHCAPSVSCGAADASQNTAVGIRNAFAAGGRSVATPVATRGEGRVSIRAHYDEVSTTELVGLSGVYENGSLAFEWEREPSDPAEEEANGLAAALHRATVVGDSEAPVAALDAETPRGSRYVDVRGACRFRSERDAMAAVDYGLTRALPYLFAGLASAREFGVGAYLAGGLRAAGVRGLTTVAPDLPQRCAFAGVNVDHASDFGKGKATHSKADLVVATEGERVPLAKRAEFVKALADQTRMWLLFSAAAPGSPSSPDAWARRVACSTPRRWRALFEAAGLRFDEAKTDAARRASLDHKYLMVFKRPP
ncbi:hypothetical protein M885DRAFT_575583 [Pelagophyceae sp. CCMP2097]|nr:hypothetical protein M885DRAFT_575583 [Pelagophyceae sp. CCMP2097]